MKILIRQTAKNIVSSNLHCVRAGSYDAELQLRQLDQFTIIIATLDSYTHSSSIVTTEYEKKKLTTEDGTMIKWRLMMLSFYFYLRIITNNDNPIIVDTIEITTTRRAGRSGRKCRVADFGRQTSLVVRRISIDFSRNHRQKSTTILLLFGLIDLRPTYPSVCLYGRRLIWYAYCCRSTVVVVGRTTVPLSISQRLTRRERTRRGPARDVYVTVWRVVAAAAAGKYGVFASLGGRLRRGYRGHHTPNPT